MKMWAWGTVAFSGLVVAAAACSSSSTGAGGSAATTTATSMTTMSTTTHTVSVVTTGSGGGTGGGSCGSTQFSNNAMCEACVESNCCAELAACDTGTPCDALFNCIGMCASGDMNCIMACEMSNSGGVSDAMALDNCFMTSCASQSACDTGTICDSGLADQNNPPCGDCLGAQCCMEFDACVKDTTCDQCVMGMTTTGCDTNAAFMAVQQCQMGPCSCQCGATICTTGLSTGNGPCDTCLGTNCCQAITACMMDNTCFNTCLMSANPPASCMTNALFMAVNTCETGMCMMQCNGMAMCGGADGG